jgi:hypothetical protein
MAVFYLCHSSTVVNYQQPSTGLSGQMLLPYAPDDCFVLYYKESAFDGHVSGCGVQVARNGRFLTGYPMFIISVTMRYFKVGNTTRG